MKSLISVIVPVYKVEKYLNKCIDSILSQTYRELEVILVDDGSPDSCGQICDYYKDTDDRVKVIHKKNGGLSDARNAGLAIATGEYIGFVDSDDWIKADMYEYLINELAENKAQIAVCNWINATDKRYMINNFEEQCISGEEGVKLLFEDKTENYAWNKLYSSSLWSDIKFPVGKNFEDVLTIYKVFGKAERIAFANEAKYYYRIRSSSISGTRNYNNRLHIYQAFCDRYEEASKEYPQYKKELFGRIRKYYCHELSYTIIHDPEDRELNWNLLKLLTSFILTNKQDIYESCGLGHFERRKFDCFCECSVAGCKKAIMYHKILKRLHKSIFA